MIYLLQASICSALFYVVYHYLYRPKNQHRFNRAYLLGALITSLLLPLLQIPVFPEYLMAQAQTGIVPTPKTAPAPFLLQWENWLLMVYALGVLVHLLILLRQLWQLARIIRRGEKEPAQGYVKVYTKQNIPLSSFLSYLIIPADRRKSLTDFEVSHERTHIRQKHSWDLLLVQCIHLFFWFNPLIHLYKMRLVEVHEYLADQSTAQQLGNEEYTNFLLQQISKSKPQPLAHNFYSLFKKRIEMMSSKNELPPWQYLAVLPALAVSLLLFSADTYPVYLTGDTNLTSTLDSLPPTEVDTVIVFDPATGQESVYYTIPNPPTKSALPKPGEEVIDTIITFDPTTFEETIQIVRRKIPARDSL
ncbi:MAG: M56 family metallopeptidase [Bacteroidota bacterium]